MTHTLPMRHDTSLAAIETVLERTRSRQVALVFPLGQHSILADAALLRQLAAFCRKTDKEVSIIGGDETLRALAVAAGFIAATTLEDDDARAAKTPKPRRQRDHWEDAYARFAAQRTTSDSRPRTFDNDYLLDEPPDYVLQLLEELPALPIALMGDQALVQRGRRTTRKLPYVADEELLREAYESAEENVTETIRMTSKLTMFPRLNIVSRPSGIHQAPSDPM